MKATMKDVAAFAGVGLGTVSRVINKNPSVKDSTRQKVEAAIAALNYEPDEYARGLKTNRSNTVALILPTVWHPFFAEFAYYVEAELSRLGMKLLLCNSNGDSFKEYEYIQMVKQNKVDGIIGITYSDIDQYVSSGLPFVSIDRHFTEDVSYVTADNYQAGQLAAAELAKRGCKTLGYIGGISPYLNETTNRCKGFIQYAEKNGITNFSLEIPEPIQHLEEKVLGFMKNHPTMDGLFTVNDFMALNVMTILEKAGIRFPEDIQIIGCDGARLSVEHNVLLSTIQQPIEDMARQSVQVLVNIIENGTSEVQKIVLPVEFISGNTTK